MRADDPLDDQLDAALATYAPPEPAPELAVRILASLPRTAGRERPRRWLPWVAAIPALAALLLAALFPLHHRQPRHAASPAAAAPATQRPPAEQQPARAAERPPRRTATSVRPVMRLAANEPLPKQEVFPTPTPLTKEEQALVALVNRNPGNITQSIAETQKQPVEPLTIAAIRIPLLDSSTNSPSDKGGK